MPHTFHNKEIEAQKLIVERALDASRDDLLVQRDDNAKYAPSCDRDALLSEIDASLAAVYDALVLVNEWAVKLDKAIPSASF